MPTNNEITIVFKAKTEEAANNIKKAAQNIEGLSVSGNKADSAMRKIGSSVTSAGNSAKSAAKSWGTMALEINSAIDLVRRGMRTLKSAYDFAKEGAKFQEISLYAKNAAERIGLSFDSMVKASQRGANGMADNFTIMKANLKALKGGLVASEKDFEQLWKIANASSDELGQSIEQTFEQITKAITTGNAKSLISMGLLPESFKKASNSTDLLKNRSELLKTVLEQLGPKADELGKYGETAADKFTQFENSLKDLKIEIGEAFIPAAMEMVSWLKAIVEQAKYAKDQIEWWSGKEIKLPELDKGVSGRIVQIENHIEELEKQKKELDKKIAEANKNGSDTSMLMNERRGFNHSINNLKKQLEDLKNNALDIIHTEQEEAKTAEKNAEAKEKQRQATENYNKIADTLSKQTLTGLNKAFGITNKTLSDNIQMMHSVGMASLGFGAQVDEGAAKAYEAMKKLEEESEKMQSSFDEAFKRETQITDFEIALENISDLNFDHIVNNFKDINTYVAEINAIGMGLISNGITASKGVKAPTIDSLGAAYIQTFAGGYGGNSGYNIYKNAIKETINSASTRHDINETADYMQKQFTDGIANAIADGFASADFSGFGSSLQSVISGVVGSGISTSITDALNKKSSGQLGGLFKEVVSKDNKVQWGNLGSNLLTGGLIGTATNFLFGEGGIFGKTKVVGKENLNKSAELNAQVDQAKELAESIYLATGISDATRELIDNAVYNKTWTSSHKSKNVFKKKKTITLHGAEQAQASIKYVEDLQKQALAEQAMNNYNNFMLGRDDSVGASYNTYQDAMKAYDASQVMLYSDDEKAGFQTDIQNKEKRIKELNSLKNKKGKYSYNYTYYANNAINTLNNEITSLREKLDSSYKYDLETRTEMLQQMEEAHVNYIKAQQDARSNLLSSFTGSSTLASLLWDSSQPKYKYTDSNGRKIYGSDPTMNMLLGNQEVMGNSDMIKTMLPLLEQSYMKDYDLNQRLNSSDENVRKEALVEQQSILEKALNSYEKIYKDAKDEALNTNLSTEEQSAAFERWQETFQAYLSLQEQIAENTKTIADIEESNALSKLSTELGDMLSIVAEIKNQKSTNNTLVFRQSLSEEEIIAKLKEVAGAKNPELASVLGEILNDKQNASIWG